MFLYERQLSSRPIGGWLLAVAFLAGLGLGGALHPLTGHLSSASAPAPRAPVSAPLRTGYGAEVLRVIDGDTFEARVHLWPGLDITTRVRLLGIDAPEMRARCDEEHERALAARDALRAILNQGAVGITDVRFDKYGGRVLANASTAGTADISTALLDRGYVRRYGGGRRNSWC